MGRTPYFEDSPKRLGIDSYCVAKVTAAEERDLCDVVQNCSLSFIPPAGHALAVAALSVDNGDNIGSLAVVIDQQQVWFWDDANEFNHSVAFRAQSRVGGRVTISVRVVRVTTVWRKFRVKIILTAFQREFPAYARLWRLNPLFSR